MTLSLEVSRRWGHVCETPSTDEHHSNPGAASLVRDGDFLYGNDANQNGRIETGSFWSHFSPSRTHTKVGRPAPDRVGFD